jgi:hypothetical protein
MEVLCNAKHRVPELKNLLFPRLMSMVEINKTTYWNFFDKYLEKYFVMIRNG